MKTRPPIYTRYYDLLGWILDRTSKFPKNMGFGLVQKIDRTALSLQEQRDRAFACFLRGELFEKLSDDRNDPQFKGR